MTIYLAGRDSEQAGHTLSLLVVTVVIGVTHCYAVFTGWRVGYIAYPDLEGDDALGQQILKVQGFALRS